MVIEDTDLISTVKFFFTNVARLTVDVTTTSLTYEGRTVHVMKLDIDEPIRQKFDIPAVAAKICMHLRWQGTVSGPQYSQSTTTKEPAFYFEDFSGKKITKPYVTFNEYEDLQSLYDKLSKFLPVRAQVPAVSSRNTSHESIEVSLHRIADVLHQMSENLNMISRKIDRVLEQTRR
jgi:hypothetical protein